MDGYCRFIFRRQSSESSRFLVLVLETVKVKVVPVSRPEPSPLQNSVR